MGRKFKQKIGGVEITSSSQFYFDLNCEMFKDLNTSDLPQNIIFELKNAKSLIPDLEYFDSFTLMKLGDIVRICVNDKLEFHPGSIQEILTSRDCKFGYNISLKHSSLMEIVTRLHKLTCKVYEKVTEFFIQDLRGYCNELKENIETPDNEKKGSE